MKITRNNHIDLPQTIKVNAKQLIHDHGDRVAESIDRFFTTQAGQR